MHRPLIHTEIALTLPTGVMLKLGRYRLDIDLALWVAPGRSIRAWSHLTIQQVWAGPLHLQRIKHR